MNQKRSCSPDVASADAIPSEVSLRDPFSLENVELEDQVPHPKRFQVLVAS